jgi:ferritin
MPGVSIPNALQTELQRQLNHELSASHSYTALAIWCFEQNLKGFSRYFYKQSSEERLHAQRFIDHLLDRGVMPVLTGIDTPRTHFDSLLDVARHARGMEQANTRGINQAYEAALAAKDYPAQVLLQWFISEQVEEEAWADEMVARAGASTTPGGMQALDRHLDRYLADRGHEMNAES